MKKIPFLISFLLIVQMASAQWNVIGWNPYLQRDTSGDSTFVLSAPSRIAIQNGVANWTPSTSSAASYLVYTALLTQTGTNAPVATVLENTLGGTVTWSYADVGSYIGTISGGFDAEKTGIIMALSAGFEGKQVVGGDIYLYTYDETYVLADDVLDHQLIEIRVYP